MSGGNSAQLAVTVVPEGNVDPALQQTIIGANTDAKAEDTGFQCSAFDSLARPQIIVPTSLEQIRFKEVADAGFDGELKQIGKGGQGAVFEATRDGAQRVIKRFPMSDAESALREWGILARHSADQIVPNPSMIFKDRDYIYIEMERFAGTVWKDSPVFAANRESNPQSAVFNSVEILLEVVKAVSILHCTGVIHRDLKPGNIMIGKNSNPIILDFGLAGEIREGLGSQAQQEASLRNTEGNFSAEVSTVTGRISGTPQYMAPEQTKEGRDVAHSKATDVYSLGAILYHILSGKPQVGAPGVQERQLQILERIREGRIEPLTTSNRPTDLRGKGDWCGYSELVSICQKAMAKEPENRYPSAVEMFEDLKRWSEGKRIEVYRPTGISGLRYFVRNFTRDNPGKVGVAAGMLSLVLGGGIYFLNAEAARAAAVARVERDVSEIITEFRKDVGRIFAGKGINRASVEDFDQARATGAADKLFVKTLDELAGVNVAGIRGRELAGVKRATVEVLGAQREFQERAAKRDEALAVLEDVRAKMIPVSFLGGNISATFPELSFGAVTGLLSDFFPVFKEKAKSGNFKHRFVALTDEDVAAARSRVDNLELSLEERGEILRDLAEGLLAMVMGLPQDGSGAYSEGVDEEVIKNCQRFLEVAASLDRDRPLVEVHRYTFLLLWYRIFDHCKDIERRDALLVQLEAMEQQVLAGGDGDYSRYDLNNIAAGLYFTGISFDGAIGILQKLVGSQEDVENPLQRALGFYQLGNALFWKGKGSGNATFEHTVRTVSAAIENFGLARSELERAIADLNKRGIPTKELEAIQIALLAFKADAKDFLGSLKVVANGRIVDTATDRWQELHIKEAKELFELAVDQAEERDLETGVIYVNYAIYASYHGDHEFAVRLFERAEVITLREGILPTDNLALKAISAAQSGDLKKAISSINQVLIRPGLAERDLCRVLIAAVIASVSAEGDQSGENTPEMGIVLRCLNMLEAKSSQADSGTDLLDVLEDEWKRRGLGPDHLNWLKSAPSEFIKGFEGGPNSLSTTVQVGGGG